jgi:hypothetical protein
MGTVVLAGVPAWGQEKIGQKSGHLAESRRSMADGADDLTMVKDQAQRIGQNAHHGQQDQGAGWR